MSKVWTWIKEHPWTTAIISVGTITMLVIIFSPKVRGWITGKGKKMLAKHKARKALAGPKKALPVKMKS